MRTVAGIVVIVVVLNLLTQWLGLEQVAIGVLASLLWESFERKWNDE